MVVSFMVYNIKKLCNVEVLFNSFYLKILVFKFKVKIFYKV